MNSRLSRHNQCLQKVRLHLKISHWNSHGRLTGRFGGGVTAATPKYHDFMHGVELNFITTDADVDIMLEEFDQKLKFHTQMDPILLSVDVETAAVMSLLDKYRSEQETYNKIREEFEKFPVIAKLTDPAKGRPTVRQR